MEAKSQDSAAYRPYGSTQRTSTAPPELIRPTERRAANDPHRPTDDALRNLLVRRALAQAPRRFTGEAVTGFGALA